MPTDDENDRELENDEEEGTDDEGTDEESSHESDEQASASSDDDGADDERESADDDAAESGDDADESDDDEAAAAAPVRATPKKGGKKGKTVSPGARLAAAKAAKAAKKAARKAERDEENPSMGGALAAPDVEPIEAIKESRIGQAASAAGEWAQGNQQAAYGIAAAVILLCVGVGGYFWYTGSQTHAAGSALQAALEIAAAPIVEPSEDSEDAEAEGDEEADDTEETLSFESSEARREAALAAFRSVSADYSGTPAARWALLSEASLLLSAGEHEDALASFRRAYEAAGDDTLASARALEGMGIAAEAAGDEEAAIEHFEHLQRLSDDTFAPVARFHLARLIDDETEALTAWRALNDDLRDLTTEGGDPMFAYLSAQTQQRLRELDPSAEGTGGSGPTLIGPGGAPGGIGGGGGLPPGLEGLPPEVLEQLRQQLAGGGAGGAGGGE